MEVSLDLDNEWLHKNLQFLRKSDNVGFLRRKNDSEMGRFSFKNLNYNLEFFTTCLLLLVTARIRELWVRVKQNTFANNVGTSLLST